MLPQIMGQDLLMTDVAFGSYIIGKKRFQMYSQPALRADPRTDRCYDRRLLAEC